MKGYQKLIVWQEAHKLVLLIYRVTKDFPKEEVFGLTSQIRRAVISVAANIVEGQARGSKKEFAQFLNIANASLVEVEYYLQLALDLNYLSKETYQQIEEKQNLVGKLLYGLIRSKKNN